MSSEWPRLKFSQENWSVMWEDQLKKRNLVEEFFGIELKNEKNNFLSEEGLKTLLRK